MTHPKPTFDAALRIAQQAITVLVRWANAKLPNECRFPEDCDAAEHAKKILNWCDRSLLQQPPENILQPLRLLFDSVKLERGQKQVHYWQAQAIANSYHRTAAYQYYLCWWRQSLSTSIQRSKASPKCCG